MKEINVDKDVRIETNNHSSKGNQPKWLIGGRYYKADHMGYESLSECVVSAILKKSDIYNFVEYAPVKILYDGKEHIGCESRNFLKKGEELFTFERLHRAYTNRNLSKTVAQIEEVKDRITYTVQFIEKVTGLKDVGKYLTAIAEVDMLFLNEDRHFNNLTVIRNENKEFRFSPIFDNGLSLLADTTTDYPIGIDVYNAIPGVRAKPFCTDFNLQTDTLEELYGTQLTISADKTDVRNLLNSLEEYYSDDIITRVSDIIFEQMRRYGVYFK